MNTTTEAPPRKKRKVFLWFFLIVQAIFLIWLITGLVSTGHTAPSAHELFQACGNGRWHGLFSSYADCIRTTTRASSDAAGVGRGLGAALIVIIWVVVDFLLAVTYGIYRLATRH